VRPDNGFRVRVGIIAEREQHHAIALLQVLCRLTDGLRARWARQSQRRAGFLTEFTGNTQMSDKSNQPKGAEAVVSFAVFKNTGTDFVAEINAALGLTGGPDELTASPLSPDIASGHRKEKLRGGPTLGRVLG
jgi:hypothetical protein